MKKKRNTIEIKRWMLKKGIAQVDICREVGAEEHSNVSKTISGTRHNAKVLTYLLEKGCPKKYLAPLPKSMEERL